MKHDIESRQDIEVLVDTFYEKVKADDIIGHFFTEVVRVDWQNHLPVMYNFWENIVFNTGTFIGNPMQKHFALHKLRPLTALHFQRWLDLFSETVDELYVGEKAAQVKERAAGIAKIMVAKLLR